MRAESIAKSIQMLKGILDGKSYLTVRMRRRPGPHAPNAQSVDRGMNISCRRGLPPRLKIGAGDVDSRLR
jgi:hypothetical protein